MDKGAQREAKKGRRLQDAIDLTRASREKARGDTEFIAGIQVHCRGAASSFPSERAPVRARQTLFSMIPNLLPGPLAQRSLPFPASHRAGGSVSGKHYSSVSIIEASSDKACRSKLTLRCGEYRIVASINQLLRLADRNGTGRRLTILTADTSGPPRPIFAPLTPSITLSRTPVTRTCCWSGSAQTATAARNLHTGSSSTSASGRSASTDWY